MKVAHKSPFLAVLQEGNFSCEQSHTISLPCPLGDEQNVNLCIQLWHMSPILFENCWVHYACHCVLLLYHRGGAQVHSVADTPRKLASHFGGGITTK